ncbi:DUF445 domain-containing protein [Clostridium folliculivorans]|uniref:DUF445 domain-containing protein n=1 Tax=Clostridium folliculivorans TaxID=2886038 RepID=UPI0021C2B463|nr:DUF445 domain-containing protein [Clostridium folliculivorans]GKU28583.1 hypothetical protein CFB3_06890 [Clostridium folliculivorans]
MKVRTGEKALASLVIMLIGFIITLFSSNSSIIILLQNGFEAGLVGGLADWFAVSALFRHPMGIPIPHTALLPRNRERITTSLVSIVENDLLNKESVINRISKISFTKKVLEMSRNHVYSSQVKLAVVNISNRIKNSISITEMAIYFNTTISEYINSIDTKKVLEDLINQIFNNNYDDKIFDVLIDNVEDVIKREDVKKEIAITSVNTAKKMPKKGMLQFTLSKVTDIIGEDKVGSKVQEFILLMLKELKYKDNPSRIMVMKSIRDNIIKISEDKSVIEKLNQYKVDISNNDKINDFLLKILQSLEIQILDFINDDKIVEEKILPVLEKLINDMSKEDELVENIDQYIRSQISNYINKNHEKIGVLVKENIEKLDTETLIDLIEDKVGDDLQWIRINGAVCGFLIGLVLGGIKLMVR